MHVKYLPGTRKMTFEEELKLKLRRIARTADYAFGTPAEQTLINLGLLEPEVKERKEKRKLSNL